MPIEEDDITQIDAAKLKRMLDVHVAFILFDLRSNEEFQAGHIKGAVQINAEVFVERLKTMVAKKDTPIVIYDADGTKTDAIIVTAEKEGYFNMVGLEGGYKMYAVHFPVSSASPDSYIEK